MKKISILFILNIFLVLSAFATHMRGGYITYTYVSGLTYNVSITTYTNTASPADRPQYTISWGDGTTSVLNRSYKGPVGPASMEISINLYYGTHTFPSPNVYIISLTDPNRNAGIINIPNSVNVPFYIETMINVFNPDSNCVVNSVNFFAPFPMVKSLNDNQFKFDFTAYDPDHDSLSYEIDSCRTTGGLNISGYTIPTGVNLNPYNGEFTWNDNTSSQGEYCFAIKINKWRHGRNVGYVLTDFQVTDVATSAVSYSFTGTSSFISSDTLGSNFIVMNPNDTLKLKITFTDAITSDQTAIHSFSEAYILNHPATFSSDSVMNISHGYFTWIPKSEYGRKRPYLLTFRGYTSTNVAEISNDLSLFIYVIGNNDTICPPFPVDYSIKEINSDNSIDIYPNPASSEIEVIGNQLSVNSIDIYNMLGERIYTSPFTDYRSPFTIDVSFFPSGMYFIEIKTQNGVEEKKFVKE
ncbi:MAG: T9SS type A sorting domain-containing protein [Bacteroidales bacterium]